MFQIIHSIPFTILGAYIFAVKFPSTTINPDPILATCQYLLITLIIILFGFGGYCIIELIKLTCALFDNSKVDNGIF